MFERTRRKPNRANRVDDATEQAVIKSATDFPAYGQARTSNELRKLGVFISPSGVRSIWLRHDLANFKVRLKALEIKVAEDGGILTEAQVQALETTRGDRLFISLLGSAFIYLVWLGLLGPPLWGALAASLIYAFFVFRWL